MKLAKYICTHCGRHFEAEEKENIECPGCYWSSSVKKDEGEEKETPESSLSAGKEDLFIGSGKGVGGVIGKVKSFFLILVILGLAAGVVFAAWPLVQSFFSSDKIKISLPSEKAKEKITPQESARTTAAAGQAPLTEKEKNILNRRLEIDPNRKPSAEEQKILDFHASFQTGLVEKLPSQAWTLENFKKLIAEQEHFYKVPLPGSYKRKLEKLFQEKYFSAQTAFEQGNLRGARDLWVASLAFPIYANDVKKHRGVVLTMLRPFVNDTLSKIGAINNVLVEGKVREKERIITEQYQSLFGLIQNQSWNEALASIQELEKGLQDLENPAQEAMIPPAYPQSVALVDEGIRATLRDLLSPSPQGFADFGPLRQDIVAKKTVVLSFLPEMLEKSRKYYQTALEMIEKGEWSQAQVQLRQVTMPLELVEDAQEKMKILEKLTKAELDSAPKSG